MKKSAPSLFALVLLCLVSTYQQHILGGIRRALGLGSEQVKP